MDFIEESNWPLRIGKIKLAMAHSMLCALYYRIGRIQNEKF